MSVVAIYREPIVKSRSVYFAFGYILTIFNVKQNGRTQTAFIKYKGTPFISIM